MRTGRQTRPRRRRLWVALGVVLVLALVSIRSLDRPTSIDYYRVVGDRTLVIGVVSGPGTWTRPTTIDEAADKVTLEVSSLTAPLPGYGDDAIEITVTLHEPIGSRPVVDAHSGQVVPRTRCLPPAFLAPGCT